MGWASLRVKLVAIPIVTVAITASACLAIQRAVIERQGIELTRGAMRAMLVEAENVRESVSLMRNEGLFRSDLAEAGNRSRLLRTVPVVAAWNSIDHAATREGYAFRIVARSPRNRQHEPKPEEEAILRHFESGAKTDYVEVDRARQEIVYARPVRLTRDCLSCHGDPTTSPTHDGRDALGFPMEHWREGQMHGVFVLRSNLSRLTPVIMAGVRDAVIWIAPVASLMGLAAFVVVNRMSRRLARIGEQLAVGAREVDQAAGQISAGSAALARGASDQAASLEATSASSEEINSMARRTAEHSRDAAALVRRSEEQFSDANRSLDQMQAAIDSIQTQSGKISQIIKVIDGIAFQTNLLALNAAVEAARAGETGMGFAVVADEVRTLAQRCAQAARDTSELIEESTKKSAEGKLKVDQVAAAIHAATGSAAAMKALVEEVHAGSVEQTKGFDVITRSIMEMQQVTQSSAAGAQQSAAAATQLTAQSQALRQTGDDLTALLAGRGAR